MRCRVNPEFGTTKIKDYAMIAVSKFGNPGISDFSVPRLSLLLLKLENLFNEVSAGFQG
jgi:hypothetical protein